MPDRKMGTVVETIEALGSALDTFEIRKSGRFWAFRYRVDRNTPEAVESGGTIAAVLRSVCVAISPRLCELERQTTVELNDLTQAVRFVGAFVNEVNETVGAQGVDPQ